MVTKGKGTVGGVNWDTETEIYTLLYTEPAAAAAKSLQSCLTL